MKSALLNILFKVSLTTSVILLSAIFAGAVFAGGAKAQSISKTKISITIQDAGIEQVLEAIEEKTEYTFHFKSSTLNKVDEQINLDANEETVADVLRAVSEKTGLAFRQVNGTIIVSKTERSKKIDESNKDDQANARVLDRTISGLVTDDKGEPLIGATVLIKGTTIGTITDMDGSYRIGIPQSLLDAGEDLILEISFVGFETQDIPIGSRTVIDVTMLESSLALEGVEVVSTGYYEIEQRFNPGNIVKLDAQTIEQQPVSNPLQALQGRLTGVNIIQRSGVPGSAFDIQIRGLNSLRENGNDPLYLINGVPYPAQSQLTTSSGAIGGQGINPLNFINPNDIESIEILKDADATAIYGSRGANGVVRITTKQGRSDKLRVTYNGSIGVGTVENKFDVLNTEQYLEMRREAFANDLREPGLEDFDVNGTWSEDRDTDWQEELLGGEANFSNHQLSFSGGSGNTNFLASINYIRQSTLYSDDLFDRKISGNFNVNHASQDNRFTIGLTGLFTTNFNNINRLSFASQALSLAPNAPALRNEDGSINWEGGSFDNPLARLLKERESRTINVNSSLNLSYEIIGGLRARVLAGYSELQSDLFMADPIASFNPFAFDNITGGSTFGNSSVNTWSVEPQLDYSKIIDKHEFNAVVGGTFQETISDSETLQATGYTNDALLRNPLAAEQINFTRVDNSEYRFNSLYGRINYIYDEKYIINLTGRRDGSSRFGPGKQFANFGAVGVGWIFSEEGFISDNLSFISFGKIRGSYGVTGSDNIGNYEFLELWDPTQFGYGGTQAISPRNLFNENFAWEETTKAEVGLELGLFEDRIQLNTSYFQNSSSNQLVGQPLPGTTGFTSVQSNFPAEVENRGLEIELNTVNIERGDFRWSSSFNISFLRNEVVSFENLEESSFAGEVEVGEPLSVQFYLDYTGVDPETGIATYRVPTGGDFVDLTDDRLPFGDRVQDYFGGLQNTLSYKGITLDFHFRFIKQVGFDPINYFPTPGGFGNQPTYVLDRWQNPGDITDIPKFSQTGTANVINGRMRASDANFADASFIRLQNVRLSYQFSQSLVSKYQLDNLTVFLQGQNLLTITDYRGWDPETQSSTLPPLRIITTGLTISL